MMRRDRRPTIISPAGHIRSYRFRSFLALILAGFLLSYVGGYINTVCLIGYFQAPIAASTGTTSKMIVDLVKGDLGMTLHFFLLIISFVSGSFISAALVGGSSFRIQRLYGLVLLLESLALASGYLFERTSLKLPESSASLQVGAYLVSLACGLQNGMCTTFSGAVIRTTHMTGVLTDIGLILGQAIFYPRTRKHLWKLKVLLPIYSGFCLGGATGWFAHQLLHSQAILVPCALVGIFGIAHLCYCKIILRYRNKQVNEKRRKKNNPPVIPVPTVEADRNANNGFDQPANGIDQTHNENEQNDEEKKLLNPDPTDLQIISVHGPKIVSIVS